MCKKIVSVLLAVLLFVCAVPTAGVFAQTTAGLSVSDNGVYTVAPFAEMPQTIEAEIKLTAAQGTRVGTLLGSWYYPSYNFLDVSVNAAGNPYVHWRKNSSSAEEKLVFTNVSVETGEWLTLKIAADFANAQVHCYINGELKQTLTTAYTAAFPIAAGMSIGNNLRQGNGFNWRGEIRKLTVSGASATLAQYDLAGAVEGDTLVDSIAGNNAVWEQKWMDTKTAVGEYDYAMAVVGDPQTMTLKYPESLSKIYAYIKDTAAEKKLAYAFTLGDLTDTTSGVTREWEDITDAMNILDGVVPHTIIRGNHDNETLYDQYITVDAYGDGVVSKDGTMKTYYRDMTIGGTDYLMVTLDWRPDAQEQAWAASVIEQHPHHRVIITTHNFTESTGEINNAGVTGDGTDIFNTIVTKYPNVALVISGHAAAEDIVVRTQKAENGNMVTHMLVDAQDVDQPIDGGAGLVAYLYFSDNGKNVEVEWYSPLRDQYYKAKNQFSFTLDLPWDESVPALSVSENDKVDEKAFTFTPAGLSPYSGGTYTASGKNYYVFPETETDIIAAIESKFHLYYDREGAVYKQRDLFTNGDSDGETRWILLWNELLQRTVSAAGGHQLFRKIDSLVPINSLGQEIVATDFKTTFTARLEDENNGLAILAFRQQTPGKYTNGYYKMCTTHAFVAIGRKGFTVAGGEDIVAKNGGDATTDMYNHLAISFDDPATAEVEMLPKGIAVTVEAHGTSCDVTFYDAYDRSEPLYTYTDLAVPFTAAGTFAYSVSDKNNSIGEIALEIYDDQGNVIDMATPSANDDTSVLRFYGGDIRVDATETADGYLYTLTVDAIDGYRLNTEAFYLEDATGKVVPTRTGANTFTVLSKTGGTVTAQFEKGAAAPMLTPETSDTLETFAFTPQGLSPYSDNKYTAVNKRYYTFPETETDIIRAIESKFRLYYNRESVLYTQRDLFTNGDTEASRWILLYDAYLQRTSSKTTGEIFRKVDSLVPLNSLGEEITLQNFETTFHARFESDDYGAIILGFRQQDPGRFVTGWYKMSQNQAFVAIGRKGITIAGGSDIVAKNGGDATTDMYNHFETRFDDPDTADTEEMLPRDIKVKIRAVGTSVKVWIYPQGQTEAVYYEEATVPYTTAGTLAYAVSTVGHDIGAVSLTKLDKDGKAADIAVNEATNAFDLTYRGGIVSYTAEETATDGTFTYTLDVRPNDGYELLAGSLYVTDGNGKKTVPTRVGFRETGDGTQYTFTASADSVVSATFVKPTVTAPNIGNIGTSIHAEKAGLRFVSRLAFTRDAGGMYVTLDGEKHAVTDYGMLIGVASVIGDSDLTIALTETNAYVKKVSVKQQDIYYDLWDTGMDMSVCITGVDKVNGGADMDITARAYVTVMMGNQEIALYADAFTSTFNKNK